MAYFIGQFYFKQKNFLKDSYIQVTGFIDKIQRKLNIEKLKGINVNLQDLDLRNIQINVDQEKKLKDFPFILRLADKQNNLKELLEMYFKEEIKLQVWLQNLQEQSKEKQISEQVLVKDEKEKQENDYFITRIFRRGKLILDIKSNQIIIENIPLQNYSIFIIESQQFFEQVQIIEDLDEQAQEIKKVRILLKKNIFLEEIYEQLIKNLFLLESQKTLFLNEQLNVNQVQQQIKEQDQNLLIRDCIESFHNTEVQNFPFEKKINFLVQEKYYEIDFDAKKQQQGEDLNIQELEKILEKEDLKEFQRQSEQEGIIFTNKSFIKTQRGIALKIIQRLGSKILQGKPIFNISLPSEMFDGNTFLERSANSFNSAPYYLEKAALEISGLEQIKLVMSFFHSSFNLLFIQEMPLNPLLGETLQVRIKGHPLYWEQISHHPPVSYFLMIGNNYRLYGYNSAQVMVNPNSILAGNSGNPVVELNGKKKIYFIWHPFQVQGILMGQRKIVPLQRSFCIEPEERLVCQIECTSKNKNSQQSYLIGNQNNQNNFIYGAVYKVKQQCIYRLLNHHNYPSNFTKEIFIDVQNEVESILSVVKGVWHSYLQFDDQIVWKSNQPFNYKMYYEPHALPSDSRYRKDKIYFKSGDFAKSTDSKEIQEDIQRNDAKLRAQFKKNKN